MKGKPNPNNAKPKQPTRKPRSVNVNKAKVKPNDKSNNTETGLEGLRQQFASEVATIAFRASVHEARAHGLPLEQLQALLCRPESGARVMKAAFLAGRDALKRGTENPAQIGDAATNAAIRETVVLIHEHFKLDVPLAQAVGA